MNSTNYTPDMIWSKFNLSPETLLNTPVLESSVYLTRNCNLKCQYCKIIKTELPQELNIDQWIEVMNILDSLGIRFVNIAGGEPTILKGLGRLIKHLNHNTSLEYSIVSNSMFNDKKLEELVDAGLKAYVASVDVLNSELQNLHDLKKASAGMKMLEKLKGYGVPYLCANIVISGTNIDNIMEVVKYLAGQGIWVNVCPIIWGRGDKWDKIEAADEEYRLKESHREKLEEISSALIKMKMAGAPIIPTESYLLNLPDHAIKLDWHCSNSVNTSAPPRLTIDADGSLMTCINMRGNMAEKFYIHGLKDEKRYHQFIESWQKDVQSCDGCYWSTMVMARERQELIETYKMEALRNGTHG